VKFSDTIYWQATVFALKLYAATTVTYKYNGNLECSVLCMIRIQPDALYLTRTTVCSYVSKKCYIVQIPSGYMVDDLVENFLHTIMQKCHQSRLPVSAWHYTKIGCENDSHNCQNARSTRHTVKSSELIRHNAIIHDGKLVTQFYVIVGCDKLTV